MGSLVQIGEVHVKRLEMTSAGIVSAGRDFSIWNASLTECRIGVPNWRDP